MRQWNTYTYIYISMYVGRITISSPKVISGSFWILYELEI